MSALIGQSLGHAVEVRNLEGDPGIRTCGANLAFQVVPFLFGEPEHEILWKAIEIAFDGAIEDAGLSSVKLGEVEIEHDLEATDEENPALDLDGRRLVSWRRVRVPLRR